MFTVSFLQLHPNRMIFHVNIGPPIITFISNRTVSLEGEKVALICMAINDADAISLQINWYKGSNRVMPKRHHIHINETAVASTQLNSTLLFNAVSRNDSGGYTCRAFNHNDSFSASKIKLIVQCMGTVMIIAIAQLL